MMRTLLTAAMLAGLGTAAFAQDAAAPIAPTGDAAEGEKVFRQCSTCHHVVDAAGEVLAGRAAVKTGPNLYGVAGRVAGAQEDFKYSTLMEAAGAQGIVWDEANFVGYVQDPTPWLQEATGESGRGKMTYKVRSPEDAANVYAYLVSLVPPAEAAAPATN